MAWEVCCASGYSSYPDLGCPETRFQSFANQAVEVDDCTCFHMIIRTGEEGRLRVAPQFDLVFPVIDDKTAPDKWSLPGDKPVDQIFEGS